MTTRDFWLICQKLTNSQIYPYLGTGIWQSAVRKLQNLQFCSCSSALLQFTAVLQNYSCRTVNSAVCRRRVCTECSARARAVSVNIGCLQSTTRRAATHGEACVAARLWSTKKDLFLVASVFVCSSTTRRVCTRRSLCTRGCGWAKKGLLFPIFSFVCSRPHVEVATRRSLSLPRLWSTKKG